MGADRERRRAAGAWVAAGIVAILVAALTPGAPAAATGSHRSRAVIERKPVAICKDDTKSTNRNFATTCKAQGGIKLWLARYVTCNDGVVFRLNRKASCRQHDGLKSLMPVDQLPKPRSGDVALCTDGTYQKAKVFKTACKSRGGVRRWLSAYGRCNDNTPIRMTRKATCKGHKGFRGLVSQEVPKEFKGKVALCNDGNYSTNTDFSATCSGGDGLNTWLAAYGECADGEVIKMSMKSSCTDDEFGRLLPGDYRPASTGSTLADAGGGSGGSTGPNDAVGSAVGAWWVDAQPVVDQIAQTLYDFSDAATNTDFAGARLQCQLLSTEIDEAKALDPLPIPEANTHWQRVLDLFGRAAERCVTGIDNLDPDAIEEASALLDEGNQELALVNDAISTLLD